MIEEVTLTRFKRFEAETFPLGGNIVLAGQNNSGKTTVLQAISAWSLAFEQWKLLADTRKHKGAYTKQPIARQAFNAVPMRSFDLLWHDRKYSGSIEIAVRTSLGWSLTMEIMADSTQQVYVRPKWDTPNEVVKKDPLSVVYVSSVDGLETEEAAINNPEWIRTLLGRQKPGSILRNLLLQVSATPRWPKLVESVKRLFGVELQVPQSPGGQIISEFKRPGQNVAYDIMSAGSGFHQVLLLLACLHTRQGSVLLIDEPDAHLHVFLQDTIFSELRSVAADTGSQIIVATHSEVIFRSVPPERLLVMMGPPRRLSNALERERLAEAMGALEQIDIIQALDAPGVLYLEGHTDLNLLRAWAHVLGHPIATFLDREPFWKQHVWEARNMGDGVKAEDHYRSLQLVQASMNAVLLKDGDGKEHQGLSPSPTTGVMNRIAWRWYEGESYLLHPAALARFIDSKTGGGGAEAVRTALSNIFEAYAGSGLGQSIADTFIAAPLTPVELVQRYLKDTKARKDIIPQILTEGGILAMDYTEYDNIGKQMLASEVFPEVKEKLDFIQQAFGL